MVKVGDKVIQNKRSDGRYPMPFIGDEIGVVDSITKSHVILWAPVYIKFPSYPEPIPFPYRDFLSVE